MHSHEIIAALGEHTTAKQLFNKLREINEDITHLDYVKYIIRHGIYDEYEKYFAYCLGLKQYHKEGWEPKKIEQKITPRQMGMGWSNDIVHPDHKKGKDHGNYKPRKRPVFQYCQRDKVMAIFDKLGGRSKMDEFFEVTKKAITGWLTYLSLTNGARGTIPVKYHARILQTSELNGLGITEADLNIFNTKGR